MNKLYSHPNPKLTQIQLEHIKLCNQFSIVTACIVLVYSLVYLLFGQNILTYIGIIGSIGLLFTILLNKYKLYTFSKYNLLIFCNLLVMFADAILAFQTEHHLYYVPGTLLNFLLFYNNSKRDLLLMSLFTLICYFIPRFFFSVFSPFLTPLEPSTLNFLKYQNFIGAMIVTCYFSHLFFQYLLNFQNIVINANKFIALGELSGSVSHEINNPLSVIVGIAQKWKRRSIIIQEDKLTIAEDLKKIELNALRISTIVDSLKNFSYTEDEIHNEKIPVSTIIQDIMGIYQKKLSTMGIEFIVDNKSSALIHCRRFQIGQVLLNLINNSISSIKNQVEPVIQIEVFDQSNQVIFKLTDSGKEIDDENIKKIQESLDSNLSLKKGYGLGLNISKNIVEAHHGHLFFNLQSPNTQFIISLPINKDS